MGHVMPKPVFGHMLAANAQISLRISTVWSGPLLSTNRITGHYVSMESKCPDEILRMRGMNLNLCAQAQRHIFAWLCPNITHMPHNLGPVVQSVISLTSALVVKMLTDLVSTVSNSVIFAEKMWVAFANAKATHIFSAKMLAYMPHLMI